MKSEIVEYLKSLQDSICLALEEADGKAKFQEDKWERPGGGGGRTRVIQHGNVLEKGGVNFSAVEGKLPEKIRKALSVEEEDFFASGVSIVLHPNNPFVPIIHMNIRYFEMSDKTWWFGGGIDLTPHYIDATDAKRFHQILKDVCEKSDTAYYPRFKKWADDYFFIEHRKETRGIGGIFFDRLSSEKEGKSKDELLQFWKNVGDSFASIYTFYMRNNSSKVFTEDNKKWQLIRRGRYVEFNLVYDKGTKFGLETDGRIESILMSLPEHASWVYNFQPGKNSLEEFTLNHLKKEIDWLSLS